MNFKNFKVGDLLFRYYTKREFNTTLKKSKYDYINMGINLVTQSNYVHVGIIVKVDKDYITVAHSLPQGFVFEQFYRGYMSDKLAIDRWRLFRIKDFNTKNLYEHATALIGTPYGFVDYIKFITFYITGKKLFKSSIKEMVCSESVSYLLYKQGVVLNDEIMFDYISPKDLINKLLAQNLVIKIKEVL